MINPFNDVPLNTKMVFVAVNDQSGCEIYLPVDSYSSRDQMAKRDELLMFLAFQEPPPVSCL